MPPRVMLLCVISRQERKYSFPEIIPLRALTPIHWGSAPRPWEGRKRKEKIGIRRRKGEEEVREGREGWGEKWEGTEGKGRICPHQRNPGYATGGRMRRSLQSLRCSPLFHATK